ncbi:MAG: hypothetical protein Kilf2KO_32680 [Rhodospirillales bacterium]
MFRDKSLVPAQAIRLLALGLLAEAPRSYADLASGVRQVTGLLIGPSLDLLAPPLQLLTIEGLVEESQGHLSLSANGRIELQRLMEAPLRQASDDLRKLIIALKLRFLPLLSAEAQAHQMEDLIENALRAQARLDSLAEGSAGTALFDQWLALEREQNEARLEWLRREAKKLTAT